MKVVVFAFGSQGDVYPYIALARGLKKAGDSVRIVTHENFDGLVQSYGLECWPVPGNVQEVLETDEMRRLLESGNFLAITARTSRLVREAAIGWASSGLEAARNADLLLAGVGGLYLALALAEKLGRPLVQAHVFPFTPTRDFPGVLFPAGLGNLGSAVMGPAVNLATHHLTRQVMWQGVRSADRAVRREVLDLPSFPFRGPYASPILRTHSVLYGFSAAVVAKPRDWQAIHVTGYWFLDTAADWTPPAALQTFLEAGPAPVYIGFGSMGNRDLKGTVTLVLAALERSGNRAVLFADRRRLEHHPLPDHVFLGDAVPHAWLFPRMAAVVHHGGAGTTAAGLRAGIPSQIIPFFGDQGFWGRRVAKLGVGPAPIPRKHLTGERLATALRTLSEDASMQKRASALGARLRTEDGVGNAVQIIRKIEAQL